MLDNTHPWNQSFKPLIWGFILSLLLTIASYLLAGSFFLRSPLKFVILSLGFFQALIQIFLYLQLGNERKPRWNLMMFLFTVLVCIILIGGSLWIMENLNYHVMPTGEM